MTARNPSRSERTVRALVIAVTVCLFVGCVAYVFISNYFYNDSTDPAKPDVIYENDTDADVVVKECLATCDAFGRRFAIDAGERERYSTSRRNKIPAWIAVEAADGRRLGCAPVREKELVLVWYANVSETGPCPGNGPATPPSSTPPVALVGGLGVR